MLNVYFNITIFVILLISFFDNIKSNVVFRKVYSIRFHYLKLDVYPLVSIKVGNLRKKLDIKTFVS